MTTWFCRDLARMMLVRAAKQLPESDREVWLEDWLGNLDHLPGGLSQLRWALPLALWGARGVAATLAPSRRELVITQILKNAAIALASWFGANLVPLKLS